MIELDIFSGIKRLIKKGLQIPYKSRLGYCGKDNDIHYPCYLGKPSHIYLYDYTLIQPGCRFIIHSSKVYIKKWSSLSCNCTVVTGNHVPTVGVNQRILGRYHINDVEKDIHIDEDCWVGANVTILGGTHLHRGVIVGANSLVNKEIPPYAVIAGVPARIIASKFTIDQIIAHEKKLYPKNERFSREELELLFNKYYEDKKNIGKSEIEYSDLKNIRKHKDMQYAVF